MNGTQRSVASIFCLKLEESISRYIKKDFAKVFLSGNLKNTVWVEHVNEVPSNVSPQHLKIHVTHIPAVRYDIGRYKKEGVIAYTPEKGSYAQEVDVYGGFSQKHKNYAENAIEKAIKESYIRTRRAYSDIAKIEIEVKEWR